MVTALEPVVSTLGPSSLAPLEKSVVLALMAPEPVVSMIGESPLEQCDPAAAAAAEPEVAVPGAAAGAVMVAPDLARPLGREVIVVVPVEPPSVAAFVPVVLDLAAVEAAVVAVAQVMWKTRGPGAGARS